MKFQMFPSTPLNNILLQTNNMFIDHLYLRSPIYLTAFYFVHF